MRSSTLTLAGTVNRTNDILSDIDPDFLIFIIIESIRNVLYRYRENGFEFFNNFETGELGVVHSNDIFCQSVEYLMEVVEVNDPMFDASNSEQYVEVEHIVIDRLCEVTCEIEVNNAFEALNPYYDLLFLADGTPQYPSVSGTFFGNKVILCIQSNPVWSGM